MAPPGNGIFVVRGELSTLMTAMRRGARWSGNSYQDPEQDGLLKPLHELKNILIQNEDLRLIEPNVFLGPFLEIIKSEETTGPVTSLALSAVNKFLSYGLIDPTHTTIAVTVENIADAVTHARFVGTDQASDGVVLMKIVQILRTLMLSPEGSALSNESVCEVMLSCFRICFEPRLNELLRRTAEQALRDMVLLLFMRLPQFVKDLQPFNLATKLKMIAGSTETGPKRRKSKTNSSKTSTKATTIPRINATKSEDGENIEEPISPMGPTAASSSNLTLKPPPLATTPATPTGNIVDMRGKIADTPISSLIKTQTRDVNENDDVKEDKDQSESSEVTALVNDQPVDDNTNQKSPSRQDSVENEADIEDEGEEFKTKLEKPANSEEYINSVGVRFTQQSSTGGRSNGTASLVPYGLPCIRELFRFLISLCNPLDKQNTDIMMHMGLNLLTVALEIGADSIGNYDTLLSLVRDEMCRNLFALLNTERLTIFAADLQVCFLLFESLRSHLKFQLEFYLTKLSEIVASENPKIPYETRELALDNLLQLWRIPGFVAELYINYDCDLYCTNLFEDLTKLLSKNSLSATQAIYSTHLLSLDALLTVIESIEKNCVAAKAGNSVSFSRHSRNNSSTDKIILEHESVANTSGGESSAVEMDNINNFIGFSRLERYSQVSSSLTVTHEQLMELKNKKRILSQGTELFNSRPEKGIQFLQENGILNPVLDPREVAHYLRENSGLDKKQIGEYISKKKNVESKILETYVKSFDFTNLRIDQALRLYLETFRLPGEAPLIFLVMEHFADHWHKCNEEPFANTDAAFRLAYAIIMLNMDQHNYNAKRLNIPMTVDDFLKNLRGLNGSSDFDQEMLVNVYNSIKNEEIVMPAEQTGIVRENYLWKVLLRRGATKDGFFNHVTGAAHDRELFQIVWGSTLAALSFMFDKSSDPTTYQKSVRGFIKSAAISSHFGLTEDFDALVLTLCKFTTLLNVPEEMNEITASVAFGQNAKAQLAIKSVFSLIHEHGDCMRESWKNILDVLQQLFKFKLLPKSMIEVEDFCEPSGKVLLLHDKPQLPKSDAGLLSSLYSYLSSDSQRQPTYEEKESIKISRRCMKEWQIDQITTESKFLQFESLQELLRCFFAVIKPPESHKSIGLPYTEDVTVFMLELMVKILIQNRDRVLPLWNNYKEPLYQLLMGGASCGYDYLLQRTTVAILKLAVYLMRNEELCPVVLQSLKMLLMLKPAVIFKISKQISIGMYELLKTSAQNIHTEADWTIVFTILECVGAGAVPPEFDDMLPPYGTKSDGALSSEEDSGLPDRGYTSDSELTKSASTPLVSSSNAENWILVNKDSDPSILSMSPVSSNSLLYPCKLLEHSPFALVKCWDSLAFIVRNVAHITPYNFESCVKCIRTFVEASLNGGQYKNRKSSFNLKQQQQQNERNRKKVHSKNKNDGSGKSKGRGRGGEESSDSDAEELPDRYQTIAIQLLDLMHTLHIRTAQIFRWWAEEGGAVPQCSALWAQGWCPLLQGIARLATDQRRQVRTSAITCLQRALLVHDLQTLSGPEWAGCFKQVLFPLLSDLLAETPSNIDASLLEESRMRTATIMSKVFLHHLTPLIALPGFNDLWIEILEYLEKFMKIGSDMLYEAMLESLKNMLLVMHSVRVFHNPDGVTHAPLWDITWSRIGTFLPHLKDELFKDEGNLPQQNHHQNVIPSQMNSVGSVGMPTVPTSPTTFQMSPQAPISQISTITNIQNLTPTLASHLADVASVPKTSIILQPPGPPINQQIQQPSPLLIGQITASVPSVTPTIPILMPQLQIQQQENHQSSILSAPLHQQEQHFYHQQQHQHGNIQTSNVLTPSQFINSDFSNIIELPLTPSPPPPVSDKISCADLSIEDLKPSPSHRHQQSSVQVSSHIIPNDLPIPISHLMAGNQYPSLTKVPPNIAQSFAPVFVQPQNIQSEGDIYNDYVKNPYNLTLQAIDITASQLPHQGVPSGAEHISQQSMNASGLMSSPQKLGVSNMFQSANYFGSETGIIPPGSEVFFGGP